MAVKEANRISLRRSRNITFATGKNITPNELRYITKNNENTVVCECEINIQRCRAGACSCRANFSIYDGYRLLSNLKNTLNRRDRACPCPQQISYKIKFTDNRKGCPYGCANILISYQPQIIIYQQHSNGGSKPPPYCVVYQIQFVRSAPYLRGQSFFRRKND